MERKLIKVAENAVICNVLWTSTLKSYSQITLYVTVSAKWEPCIMQSNLQSQNSLFKI